jgi:sec-independent protein translocase protein TatA
MPTPGPLELVIILVIALIILGPGKLPDVGASLGKSIREFRKASSDLQDAATVKVETTPLPPTQTAQPPVANAAPYVQPTPADVPAPAAPDPNDRIAELERQLAEARSTGSSDSRPVGAGSSREAGTSASS